MKRKVIQIADSTQLVSLPRKWAVSHNIKKGDELDVEVQGNKVLVSTNKDLASQRVEADVSKLNDKLVHWILYIFHKSGYDEIDLKYDKPAISKVIQDTISEGIMGFEIIEQTPDHTLIKNIATGLEREFDTILRRIFLVTLNMAKSSLDVIKEGKFDELTEIIVLEKTNNKLTNFCERLLNKKGYKDQTKTSFVYLIVWQFEKIADDIRDLCKFLISQENKKKTLSKEVLELYNKSITVLDNYYNVFYKQDDKLLAETVDSVSEIKKEALKIFKTKNETDIIVTTYLRNMCQKVLELSASAMALKY